MTAAEEDGSSSGGADSDQVPAALAPLWERARPNMVSRVQVLKEALGELERGGLTQQTREAATREAHKLAGSLGTYGLMSGSKLAREIELRLEKGHLPAEEADWFRRGIQQIDALLHKQAAGAEATKGTKKETKGPGQETAAQRPGVEDQPLKASLLPEDATVAYDEEPSSVVPKAVVPGEVEATIPSDAAEGPGDASGVEEGIDPLGRLASIVERALTEMEGALAESIRETGPSEGIVVLEAEASRLLAVTVLLEEVGMDVPARRARELAYALKEGFPRGRLAKVAEEVLTLQRLVQRPRKTVQDGSMGTVVVVSSDARWGLKVAAALQVAGHPVGLFGSLERFMDRLHKGDVAGVVLDETVWSNGDADGKGPLARAFGTLPTVLALRAPDTKARVGAGRSGVDRVITSGLPAREVASVFVDLMAVWGVSTGRVLLVDDDPTILQAVQVTLEAEGFEVATVDGPAGFWRALEETTPDLVVTDLDMPGMDGADLCLALRTHPRWVNLPVVFLSSRNDAPTLRRVFEAGADDFVPKPLQPAVLVARVRGRLARLKARRETGHVDPVTRLPWGVTFEDALEDLVMVAQRQRRMLSVAVLRIDEAPRLRQMLGSAGLEQEESRLARLLGPRVASPGLLGRRDSDRFVVALWDLDLADAKALLQRVLQEFQREVPIDGTSVMITASCGVASMGPHGNGVVQLVSTAEDSRLRAEQSGGSVVFLAGTTEGDSAIQKVDIVVLDDDPTIGELLVETLGQMGWQVVWEGDSERAVERLAGQKRDLVARVLLLDVNMPNMDGLTVLRLLRERNVVPPMKVIMLTVRAREDEVVRALKMGASDHVAKPFSVPVLTSRIQRALRGGDAD
jgi:PleD family two-component response regulator/HPt (histidine-containing phosphotransfer) domain-containing protein